MKAGLVNKKSWANVSDSTWLISSSRRCSSIFSGVPLTTKYLPRPVFSRMRTSLPCSFSFTVDDSTDSRILLKSWRSIFRNLQLASLSWTDALRTPSLIRASFPNSSPSCNVHTIPFAPIMTLTDPFRMMYHESPLSPWWNKYFPALGWHSNLTHAANAFLTALERWPKALTFWSSSYMNTWSSSVRSAGLFARIAYNMASGPRCAMVSKHSSNNEDTELRSADDTDRSLFVAPPSSDDVEGGACFTVVEGGACFTVARFLRCSTNW